MVNFLKNCSVVIYVGPFWAKETQAPTGFDNGSAFSMRTLQFIPLNLKMVWQPPLHLLHTYTEHHGCLQRQTGLSRASFNQQSFLWFFILLPNSSQLNTINLTIYFNFISHSISFRTESSTLREKRGGKAWKEKNGTKVGLLGDKKCNFTVNLLWCIISQQWGVGWYEPSLAPAEMLEHHQWLSGGASAVCQQNFWKKQRVEIHPS